NCPELRHGSRHWSVGRHIERKHNGVGEPISLNTGMTRSQMGLYPFPSQINRTKGVPNGRAFTPNHPNKNFQSLEIYDRFEKYNLTLLRQKVEFANLSGQLNSKYPQGKFAWNATNQYASSAFVEPLQIKTDNLFGCITLQCEHCLCFEIHPFYFYDRGNIESKTTKVDHVCPNNPLILATFLSDIEKKNFNAEQMSLIHSKLKSEVLNQWSNDNSFYLFATKLPNSYTKGIVNISYSTNPCDKSVALQYLQEHTIELIELDNLKDDHWAKRVMREKIKCVTLNDEELTDFLYTMNNATFGFINVRTKTCCYVYLVILSPIASLNIRLDNY
ncbi:MAG: hypothetical protein QN720_12550, partial [Nitrososphaeraceae archaeon]|nr:hypothetical protein [Nitrososphaeraceae archaeon]MDW0333774.1 hypothetical protein [Nitrososphaeraceae archaeon]